MKHTRIRFGFLGLELLSIAVGIVLFNHPLATTFSLPSGQVLFGWVFSWFRLGLPVLLLLLAGLAFLLQRQCHKALVSAVPTDHRHPLAAYVLDRIVAVLVPWFWLPAVCFLAYFGEWIGPVPATTAMTLLVVLLAAISLEILYSSPAPPAAIAHPPVPWQVLFIAIYFIVLFVTIPSFITASGDEKHYQIQRESIITEHNLNLNTEFRKIMEERGTDPNDAHAVQDLANLSHIKRNTSGNYYSYHSFGLPILALPFAPLGKWGDAFFLAVISCLGILGCRSAALAAGAPRRATDLLVILTALSTLWGFNSGFFLPEILGCTLAAWAFWAICTQPQRPRATTAIAAFCCTSLPYFHIRFLPLAAMLALAFGLEGLFWSHSESWPRKLLRLALFSIACFAAWGLLAAIQAAMFRSATGPSTSYKYGNVLFAYPRAMWAMWADRRGLGALFPLLYWLTPATLLSCLLGSAPERRHALYATLTTLAVLLTCCTTKAALLGVCLQGRYLMQTVPLLLPFGAILLAKTSRPGRLWAFLLAAPSVLMFLFIVPQITGIKGGVIFLPAFIRKIAAFECLWEPLCSFPYAETSQELVAASVYTAMLLLAGVAAALKSSRLQTAGILLCLLLALPAGAIAHHYGAPDKPSFAPLFDDLPYHYYSPSAVSPSAEKPDLFSFISEPQSVGWYLSDTPDPSFPHLRTAIIRDIAPNDWTPQNRRWFSAYHGRLIHNDSKGRLLIRIRGEVLRGQALVAAKQGADLLLPDTAIPSGPFDITFILRTRRHHGWVAPVFAFENDTGLLFIRDIAILPYQPAFTKTFAPLPPETTLLN